MLPEQENTRFHQYPVSILLLVFGKSKLRSLKGFAGDFPDCFVVVAGGALIWCVLGLFLKFEPCSQSYY